MGKDLKRAENCVPYVHVPVKNNLAATSFAASNMPMVAMFMRNKPLAWSSLFMAVQSYLNEPEIKDPNDESQAQSPIMKVGLAVMAVIMSYMDLIFPTVPRPAKVAKAVETAATAVTAAATAAATTAATA